MATVTKMVPREKKIWVDALLSDLYPQGHSALRNTDVDDKTIGYCCLGLARKVISGKEPSQNACLLRNGAFGLSRAVQKALASANDPNAESCVVEHFKVIGLPRPARDLGDRRSSFKAIGAWVRKYL